MNTAEGAADLSQSNRFRSLVQIFNGYQFLANLPILGGTVTEDETATVRRSLSLTVDPTVAAPGGGNFVPNQPGDLLHPLSNNDLYVYNGVQLDSGAFDVIPMGVFRNAAPQMDDTGAALTMALTGNDRSFIISQRVWTLPYTGAAGLTVDRAIIGILVNQWGNTQPPLQFNFTPSNVVVPYGTVLGIQVASTGSVSSAGSGANDPWADCQLLAASAGMEVLFNRTGVVVLRPVPVVGGAPSVVTLAEGANSTMSEISRTMDASAVRNGVMVIGTGNQTVASTSGVAVVTSFSASTSAQTFQVPAGVTSLEVTVKGGQQSGGGADGGSVDETISAVPGDIWTILVGAAGSPGGPSGVTDQNNNLIASATGGNGAVAGTGTAGPGSSGVTLASNNVGDGSVVIHYTAVTTVATQLAPVQAIAWDTNPLSPTYWEGQYGQVMADPIVDPNIADAGTALVSAQARLALLLASADTTTISVWPPNPTLDAGDIDTVTRARLNIVGLQYVISAVEHPLGLGDKTGVTNRSSSASAAQLAATQ